MYTYVARGLGPFFGWLMAWAFALAEPGRPLRARFVAPAAIAALTTQDGLAVISVGGLALSSGVDGGIYWLRPGEARPAPTWRNWLPMVLRAARATMR